MMLPPDELLKAQRGRIETGHLDDDARKSCECYYRYKIAQPGSSVAAASGSDADAMLSMPESVAAACNHGRLKETMRWDGWCRG